VEWGIADVERGIVDVERGIPDVERGIADVDQARFVSRLDGSTVPPRVQPRLDVLLQEIEGQRAVAEDLVVEGAEVEGGT
jgi:hypothetical protein